MDKNRDTAYVIVELFEDLLEEKSMAIPCEDPREETERFDGGNTVRLYGMEYGQLVDRVQAILSKEC